MIDSLLYSKEVDDKKKLILYTQKKNKSLINSINELAEKNGPQNEFELELSTIGFKSEPIQYRNMLFKSHQLVE
jgi:hypothetical protein